jgi:hypothetical protein
MLGTSPTGLSQIERKCLAAAPCKRRTLHIHKQLERRKSSSHPIRRCRSRSPALCQRHQYLPDKQVGHVSFPTKRQNRCIFYYAGYNPTLAVEGFKESSEATFKVSRICSEVSTSGRLTPLRSTPLGSTPRSRIPHHDPAPNSHLWCGVHLLLFPHLNSLTWAHSLGGDKQHKKSMSSCWRLNNASNYDPQVHESVVAFPLEYSPKVNQSVEQVDCYAQLSTNVVDSKLFIKYV